MSPQSPWPVVLMSRLLTAATGAASRADLRGPPPHATGKLHGKECVWNSLDF